MKRYIKNSFVFGLAMFTSLSDATATMQTSQSMENFKNSDNFFSELNTVPRSRSLDGIRYMQESNEYSVYDNYPKEESEGSYVSDMSAITRDYSQEEKIEMLQIIAEWWNSNADYHIQGSFEQFPNPTEVLAFISNMSIEQLQRDDIIVFGRVCGIASEYLGLGLQKMDSICSGFNAAFLVHEYPYVVFFSKKTVELYGFFVNLLKNLRQKNSLQSFAQVQDIIKNLILPQIFKIKEIGARLYLQTLQTILEKEISPQFFSILEKIHDVFLLFQTKYLIEDIRIARHFFELVCLIKGYYQELPTELSDEDELLEEETDEEEKDEDELN